LGFTIYATAGDFHGYRSAKEQGIKRRNWREQTKIKFEIQMTKSETKAIETRSMRGAEPEVFLPLLKSSQTVNNSGGKVKLLEMNNKGTKARGEQAKRKAGRLVNTSEG
jgi:hypothetical protein